MLIGGFAIAVWLVVAVIFDGNYKLPLPVHILLGLVGIGGVFLGAWVLGNSKYIDRL